MLLPLFTFLILHRFFRSEKLGQAYLVFITLMATHTFFWVQSELPQGMAFLFLLMAVVEKWRIAGRLSKSYLPVTLVLVFLVAFTHPLLLIAFVFFILWYLSLFPSMLRTLAGLFSLYLLFFVLKVSVFSNPYDQQAMGGVHHLIDRFPHYLDLPSSRNLWQYLRQDYYMVPLVLFILTVFYVRRQAFFRLLLLWGFVLGYGLLVNTSYPEGGAQFYLENQYLLWGFMLGLPLAFEVFTEWLSNSQRLVFLSGLCAFFLFRIVDAHELYTRRLNWNRHLLAATSHWPQRKIVLAKGLAPQDTLLMTWASSYEFWLLSTIEQGTTRSVHFEQNEGELNWALSKNKTLLTTWGCFDYQDLPEKYFRMQDTSAYIRISKLPF